MFHKFPESQRCSSFLKAFPCFLSLMSFLRSPVNPTSFLLYVYRFLLVSCCIPGFHIVHVFLTNSRKSCYLLVACRCPIMFLCYPCCTCYLRFFSFLRSPGNAIMSRYFLSYSYCCPVIFSRFSTISCLSQDCCLRITKKSYYIL